MRALLLAVVCAMMLVAGCAGAPSNVTPAPSPAGTPTPVATPAPTAPSPTPDAPPTAPADLAPGEGEVFIRGNAFVERDTSVFAGTSVGWINMDRVDHTVTADDGSFDSGPIRAEYGFDRMFGTPGNYSYHCAIHASMKGTIVVLGDEVVVLTPPPTPTESTSPTSQATPTPAPTSTPTPTPAPTPPPVEPALVEIQSFTFTPQALSVPTGATVRWKNHDGAPHTATADGGAFDTGTLSTGATAERTFSTSGTFPYHCAIHPSMTGTLTVTG